MKIFPLFSLILLSLQASAQFPKPGTDGYIRTTTGERPACPDIVIENKRNSFYWASVGNAYDYGSPEDSLAMLQSIFSDHKFFYNGKYFYSTYKVSDGYIYKIFLLQFFVIFSVTSKYNDAEFEKCKRMTDTEALYYINGDKYIFLLGYKCLNSKNKLPGQIAEMYNERDTFLCVSYKQAIADELKRKYPMEKDRQKRENILPVGLNICFGDLQYQKTKDSLYVATGKFSDRDVYYYKVLIPERALAISVRSNKNGAEFSKKSRWLLGEIRDKRADNKRVMSLMNEKEEFCTMTGSAE